MDCISPDSCSVGGTKCRCVGERNQRGGSTDHWRIRTRKKLLTTNCNQYRCQRAIYHSSAARGCITLFLCGLLKCRRNRRYARSEEHTSELQSRENLVCRLLLEKKKIFINMTDM